MTPTKRRQKILELIQAADMLLIDDLVDSVGVSPSTIRRDVNTLMESGDVIALRGGAIRFNDKLSELPATAKALLNQEAKLAIAAEAAKLVEDGDVIYLDSGSTTLQMMPFLRAKRIQLVTSNTQVFAMAEGFEGRIITLGGEYLPNLGSIVGPMTERELEDMSFDKAFIGASGCSLRGGINTFDMREASKKRIIHEHSREPFVLADVGKFGHDTFYKAIEFSDCFLITDSYHELLESARGYRVASTGLHVVDDPEGESAT